MLPMDRMVPAAGISNFRDYGGYPAAGGRLRKGSLFRSAHLGSVTPGDIDLIHDAGISCIIDLRGDSERVEFPRPSGPDFRPRHYHADGETVTNAPHLAADSPYQSVEMTRARMINTYREFVGREQLLRALRYYFDRLLDGPGAQLIHCHAGKDRTGFGVALLHHILGVHQDDIVEDYMLTNVARNIEAILDHGQRTLSQKFGEPLPIDVVRVLMSTDAAYLEAAFDQARVDYGSVENFLEQKLGVGADECEKLRARYIV